MRNIWAKEYIMAIDVYGWCNYSQIKDYASTVISTILFTPSDGMVIVLGDWYDYSLIEGDPLSPSYMKNDMWQ